MNKEYIRILRTNTKNHKREILVLMFNRPVRNYISVVCKHSDSNHLVNEGPDLISKEVTYYIIRMFNRFLNQIYKGIPTLQNCYYTKWFRFWYLSECLFDFLYFIKTKCIKEAFNFIKKDDYHQFCDFSKIECHLFQRTI